MGRGGGDRRRAFVQLKKNQGKKIQHPLLELSYPGINKNSTDPDQVLSQVHLSYSGSAFSLLEESRSCQCGDPGRMPIIIPSFDSWEGSYSLPASSTHWQH